MTAPLAPSPSPAVWTVVGFMVAVAIVIPFARRDDWLGWLAFLVVFAANVVIWGLLLWAFVRAALEWHRGRLGK